MKELFVVFVLSACIPLFHSCSERKEVTASQALMNWRYDVPATKYWEGLPIGTGRFGAMIPGSVGHEVIAFNDETLWTGGPYNPNNPKGPEALEKIRAYAFARDWLGAYEESRKLGSDPEAVQRYQPMGRLNFRMEGHEQRQASQYRRSLSMDSAIVNVNYFLDGVKYNREVFASYPDQVIVVRLTADHEKKINVSGWLTSLQPSATARIENDEIIMEGTVISDPGNEYRHRILPPEMRWSSRLKIIPEGGSMAADHDKLVIKEADAVTFILSGATNWMAWNNVSGDEKKRCYDYMSAAARYSYKELLKRHLDDYCPLFAACRIDLGKEPDPRMTTTEVLQSIRDGAVDPAYEARYFQYGRYLLLAAAREGTLAFNNHNMWLNDLEGRWQGRWTLNINLQECYWPVESTNLPRINESLLLFVEQLAQAGERTAKELYNCRGWCAHHGTDVWFNTAPTDGEPVYATWPVGGVWLMQQLYDHYFYGQDPDYLRRIYPLMKGAALFCLDFMVTDPVTGYTATCPASSPENHFKDEQGRDVAISFGSSGDNQLIRNLFRNCIEASELLQTDPELSSRMSTVIRQMPPHQIGRFGQLQEWVYDFTEWDVTHRHLSHLFAAYPDDDIALRSSPELAEAVKVTLKRRGDINRGWSGAWKINLHARLEEPEAAYNILHTMLTDISIHPSPEDSDVTPSFEGNQAIQGITAGITELLMQSHSGEISLLPALPVQWPAGAIEGLRARGGFGVDLSWKDGQLNKAVIRSTQDAPCRIRTKKPVKIYAGGKAIETSGKEENVVEFQAKTGWNYVVEQNL
ncbi:MAG: glycoside hydrolase N-terminal domain-containing protein [Tannerellaceae bacterium]|jgi:alpha-L-fucosidase 2|nr:glycoside hydrolase N-terminal domain-containing protein [Tannerellaceae bacterium]